MDLEDKSVLTSLERSPRPRTYRTIRIEDIDGAIRDWFDTTVDSHVNDQRGQRQKVKVIWSSGERWVTGKDVRGVRDKDGRLILPLMAVRRVALSPTTLRTALGANVPRLQISRLISPQSAVRIEQAAARSLASRNVRSSAVYEVTTVPFPFVGEARYELVIQAQYLYQVNEIIEKIFSKLEFFNVPTFVAFLRGEERSPAVKDGVGSSEVAPSSESQYDARELIDSYYVCGFLDGDLSDSGNLEEFTDQERIVKTTMQFTVPVSLMLDPEGTRPAAQVEMTAASVELSDDTACFVDDPVILDIIFGNGRVDPAVVERLTKSRRR